MKTLAFPFTTRLGVLVALTSLMISATARHAAAQASQLSDELLITGLGAHRFSTTPYCLRAGLAARGLRAHSCSVRAFPLSCRRVHWAA